MDTSKTGYVFTEEYVHHTLTPFHPESPERLIALKQMMEDSGLSRKVVPIKPSKNEADIRENILKVHDKNHLESVISLDTTGKVSLLAVSGVLSAVDAVFSGEISNAFCAVRPPGHHAHNNGAHYEGMGQGEGFCFFNNIAIAAKYARDAYGCERILIIDWDFHHGNGTEWSFYDDPTVFFFSTHALFAYPGTGSEDRRGKGKGLGYNLNVPLDTYATDGSILSAWEYVFLPMLREIEFKPDLVLISAGFDSRIDDLLGSFRITDEGFARLTETALRIAEEFAENRLISVLEGGYNPQGLASAVNRHIQGLLST